MKLSKLGICGLISLLSYTAMVLFSPLAYPGYDWMSMAVSDLSAEGAPSQVLADRLNALFGPCGIVSIMAVCAAMYGCKSKSFRWGIFCFAAMEWVCNVGYKMFPWVMNAPDSNPSTVILSGSPPKAEMFSLIHFNAAIWSSRPRFMASG